LFNHSTENTTEPHKATNVGVIQNSLCFSIDFQFLKLLSQISQNLLLRHVLQLFTLFPGDLFTFCQGSTQAQPSHFTVSRDTRLHRAIVVVTKYLGVESSTVCNSGDFLGMLLNPYHQSTKRMICRQVALLCSEPLRYTYASGRLSTDITLRWCWPTVLYDVIVHCNFIILSCCWLQECIIKLFLIFLFSLSFLWENINTCIKIIH